MDKAGWLGHIIETYQVGYIGCWLEGYYGIYNEG